MAEKILMDKFTKADLLDLYKPHTNSKGEDNGQVTIIGGSKLFHGAPLFGVKIASRIVDMVFFASPDESVGKVAEKIKSKLFSFIWIPWSEVDHYIQKSDAILIGPGLMRFKHESKSSDDRERICDEECEFTRQITKDLLIRFPNKRWVIDAGSLQTMSHDWMPSQAILTPNAKEYKLLFGSQQIQKVAKKFNCIIVHKGPTTVVCSTHQKVEIKGGNPGLTKGGTGDVQAGLTAALLAKNDPFLAACSGAFITKYAADELYKKVAVNYNADDLANEIPHVLSTLIQG